MKKTYLNKKFRNSRNSISTFLLLSLDRYLCWWTISPRVYHPPSSQCFCHWVDTSAGGLLVPEGIVHPVVSVSALTWLIKYMETSSLIHVIINTTKVLLFQPYVTVADFGYSV